MTAGKAKASTKKRAKAKAKQGAPSNGRFSKDKYIEQMGNFEAIAMLDGHLGKLGDARRTEDVSRLERAEGKLDLKLAQALQKF